MIVECEVRVHAASKVERKAERGFEMDSRNRFTCCVVAGLALGIGGCAVERRISVPYAGKETVHVVKSSWDRDCRDGVMHLDNKDYERALHCFEATTERNPKDWRGWFGLGLTQEMLGRYAEALDSYKRANLASRTEQEQVRRARTRVEQRLGRTGMTVH